MTEVSNNQIFISEVTFSVKNLSWSEKILIEKINLLDNSEKGCYAGSQFLADFLGVKPPVVKNMLSKLVRDGFLIRIGFDGHNRGYRSTLHYPEPSQKNDCSNNKQSQNYYGSAEPSQKSDANRHKIITVESEKDSEPSQFNENEPSQKSDHSLGNEEEEFKNIFSGGLSNNLTRTREESSPPSATDLSQEIIREKTKLEEIRQMATKNPTNENNLAYANALQSYAKLEGEFLFPKNLAVAHSPPKPKTKQEKLDELQKKYPKLNVRKVREKYLKFCRDKSHEPKWQIFENNWLKTEFEPMDFDENENDEPKETEAELLARFRQKGGK